jgi:diguanylate cyclase (GGDEF)-like protein/PAS domain S-box-containing protein
VGIALTQAELLEALRYSEERYRMVVENQSELICRFLPDGTLTFVNEAFCQYSGQPQSALIGELFTHPTNPADQEKFWQHLVALNQETPVGILNFEIVTPNGDTSWYQWTNRAIFNRHGQIVEYQSVGCDVTELRRAEARLLHDAVHDGLTGMPNRTLFMDRLEQAIKHSQSNSNFSFAVLFVDLDRFKVVNDSLGHLVGDKLLIATAQRLQSCLRANDTLARLGGDEFAILLEDFRKTDDAQMIASRIRAAVVEPLQLNGQQITITASIGIALNHAAYHDADELLRDADIAMYQAKAQGRDQHAVFNPKMHLRALALLQLENELRRAVEQQEFRVYYQPIFSLSNQQILGFEALVRWQHPQRGVLYPQEFISVAEETSLIVPLGWWVLREATRQVAQWQAQLAANPPLAISVNLSGQQFSQPDLVAQVAAILQESGLNSRCLRLEITEGVIMLSAESATTALSQLREMGVQLNVDDFGTGYSSLNRLHSFPLDTLKIDRSFVSQLDATEGSVEIVRAIITLAHNLRMDVIAEGVETAAQAQRLKILGCEYAQGYFLGRPLPGELTETLLISLMEK